MYGGIGDHVSAETHKLGDGDVVSVGAIQLRAFSAPCHTRGSLVYQVPAPAPEKRQPRGRPPRQAPRDTGSGATRARHPPQVRGPTPIIFGGDTLFCGGCGAPFEGTQAEMNANFAKIWRLCDASTLVFPGHEYATTILPGYLSGSAPWPETQAAYAKICNSNWRAQELRMCVPPVPTVPLLLADEILINSNFMPLRHGAEHLAAAWRQFQQLPSTLFSHREPCGRAGIAPAPHHCADQARSGRSPAVLLSPSGASSPSSSASSTPLPSPLPSPPTSPAVAADTPPPDEEEGAVRTSEVSLASISEEAGEMGSSARQPPHLIPPRTHGVLSRSYLTRTQPSVSAAQWFSSAMVVVQAEQMAVLEDLVSDDVATGRNTGRAKAHFAAMRWRGELTTARTVEGTPTHARVHNGPPPQFLGTGRRDPARMIVTTTEVAEAFGLLASSPGPPLKVHRDVLVRALTCTLLQTQPLTVAEVARMLAHVGADAGGFISAERFNAKLMVLPPMADAAPPKVGKCRRFARWLTSWFRGRSAETKPSYEEADFSDEGAPHDGIIGHARC